LLSTLLLMNACWAHPVAQGQLQVEWHDSALRIDARISGEQILVASALLPDATADSLAGLQRVHGHYLLGHLQVRADGAALAGRLLEVLPVTGDFVLYRLSYPLAHAPRQLQLQQDLLNEIAYAPGNPWEASFLVRTREPRGQWRETLLASRNQPLVLEISKPRSQLNLAWQFMSQGIHHILAGYDHLLFVGALVLAALTLRNLLGVIGAFTLAHSLTLMLSALQWVRLPSSLVEPVIAASIVAVALSNLLWPERHDSWGRYAMAFGFGLFHGLGFAGGLLEATEQLSTASLAIAISGFSVGVECGHLLVVIPLFYLLQVLRSARLTGSSTAQASRLTLQVGSAFISMGGMFYLAVALP
jgi:hypothetical protein